VYLLKDDLKQLWQYRDAGYAQGFWQQWYDRAVNSGIKPLKRFAEKLEPYLPDLLAHCRKNSLSPRQSTRRKPPISIYRYRYIGFGEKPLAARQPDRSRCS